MSDTRLSTDVVLVNDQDQLDDMLLTLNEQGGEPVVVGFDRLGAPFLAYGYAPGGDGWAAGFINDDPHSSEFDLNDVGRCQECGAFGRRSIAVLNYPLRVTVGRQP